MLLLREGSEIMGEVKNTMAESLDRLRRMCESVDAQVHLIAERDAGTQKFLDGHRQDMEDLYKGIVEAYKDSERQKYETDGLVYMSDAWTGDMVRASNAAKMRAALEQIAHYDDSEYGMDDYGCADGHNCADIARTALAAPSRNCDAYDSADEMMEKYADDAFLEEWREWRKTGKCDSLMLDAFLCINWLFLTNEKGATDGK